MAYLPEISFRNLSASGQYRFHQIRKHNTDHVKTSAWHGFCLLKVLQPGVLNSNVTKGIGYVCSVWPHNQIWNKTKNPARKSINWWWHVSGCFEAGLSNNRCDLRTRAWTSKVSRRPRLSQPFASQAVLTFLSRQSTETIRAIWANGQIEQSAWIRFKKTIRS